MMRAGLQAWAVVAAGGALGASLRWAVGLLLARPGFPWSTLTVNVVGSALAGLAWAAFAGRFDPAHPWRGFVMVGLLGGFTTFSAFSLETLVLMEQGAVARAGASVVANVLLCLVFCWCGLELGRRLWS